MSEQPAFTTETSELRKVFDRLMTHIERQNGTTLNIAEDYFYSVPFPAIYDMNATEKPELTIGQLTESWDNLQKTGDRDTISFELVWLADILKAIGHEQK
jgi:hypothetical protein